MCGPTTTTTMKTATTNETKSSESPLRRGVLYGTISLALVVMASSVTIGHYQSQRDQLGCDSMCVGSMTSARSALSLIGSTVIGRCSDSSRFQNLGGARRIFLLLGVVASALGVIMAVTAASIQALWISMIPAALLQQNFNILKALFGDYHSTSASPSERGGSVGMLGMASGLAFMAGPLAGSMIFKSYEQASVFAMFCLVAAFGFICILPAPPTSLKERTDKDDEKKKATAENPSRFSIFLPDLVPAARTPAAIFIMVARICMGLSFHIFQTIWTVALQTKFHFGPQDYGRYYAFIGLSFALSQGFVAKLLLNKFGTTLQGRARLLLACALVLGGGRLYVYQTTSLVVVYVIYGAIITALGVVNTIFAADTSQIADPSELGGLFGILASVESLAGIAGPILGGALAKVEAERAPLLAVVGLYGIVFAMVYWGYERIVGGQTSSSAAGKNKVKEA
jgi:DHA1 family tetracycline resistance protein-like MFS transporter